MVVTFELHPREPRAESCWIFVNGELVEKCSPADRVARLAAYGRVDRNIGGWQSAAVKRAVSRS